MLCGSGAHNPKSSQMVGSNALTAIGLRLLMDPHANDLIRSH